MAKKTLKPIVLSILAATIIFNNVAPAIASAETVVKQQHPPKVSQVDNYNYEKYELGPDGLKKAIETTGSNALVMDLYALTVLKQPKANFNNIHIVETGLQKKISSDQHNARENAKVWLDQLKPQIITTNQNIINYDNKFEGYYDGLMTAADNKDLKALASRLSRLSNSVSENKAEVNKLIVDLKKFRQKLQSDTQNLKTNANELSSIFASQDAGIPLLQKQIDAYYEALSKYNNILIASSIATSVGPLAIVGGTVVLVTGAGTPLGIGLIASGVGLSGGGITGIILAKKGIDEAQEEIKNLTGKVTDAQIQLAGVTGIKKQMEHLTNTIDLAIDALQNISTQWNTMDSKYKNLLTNINMMSPQDLDLLKEDLSIAKVSWKNVKEFAEKLYTEDISLVDS